MKEQYDFQVRVTGVLMLPTNEYDEKPIHDVRFVPLDRLPDYGFSERSAHLAAQGFPGQESYMGDKRRIGLWI